MSEYLSKKAVLEWLDDRRYKSPWIESFRDRLESGAFDADESEGTWKATEPTGARREICPDHPDEKPQISSSHTWTQDGNTYFVSYVEYCPTCYHVISTSARL